MNDDLASLVDLWLENVKETNYRVPDAYNILSRRRQNGEDILIANLDSRDVGYAMGKNYDGVYTSQGIFVTHNLRKRGIASALKEEQIDIARQQNCFEFRTEIFGDNPASVALQRRFGFNLKHFNDTYKARLVLY